MSGYVSALTHINKEVEHVSFTTTPPPRTNRKVHDGAATSDQRAIPGRIFDVDAKARLILIASMATFLLIWQMASQFGFVDALFVSSPAAIFQAGGEVFTEATVWGALAETGRSIVAAFSIGTAAGIAAGFIIGLSRTVREAFYGIILFLMSTPKSIFLPLFLLVFGIGPTAAVAFASFETFFYVCVNVVGGVAFVETRHLRIVEAFRGKWWHRLIDVVIPAATPGIFTGIWYGVKHAFLGVIIVELFISIAGLGHLIHQYTNNLETDKVLLLVFTVIVVSILAGTLWSRLESRLTRWRPQSSSNARPKR
jgi:ABC-type nitrate/sulfonate/bicarbonate transport system permease component